MIFNFYNIVTLIDMWPHSVYIVLDKSAKLLNYVKFIKFIIEGPTSAQLRYLLLAISNKQQEIRVTEHINLEWAWQADEHDVFNWLQASLRKKEAYKFVNEDFIFVLVYEELTTQTLKYIDEVRKCYTI